MGTKKRKKERRRWGDDPSFSPFPFFSSSFVIAGRKTERGRGGRESDTCQEIMMGDFFISTAPRAEEEVQRGVMTILSPSHCLAERESRRGRRHDRSPQPLFFRDGFLHYVRIRGLPPRWREKPIRLCNIGTFGLLACMRERGGITCSEVAFFL